MNQEIKKYFILNEQNNEQKFEIPESWFQNSEFLKNLINDYNPTSDMLIPFDSSISDIETFNLFLVYSNMDKNEKKSFMKNHFNQKDSLNIQSKFLNIVSFLMMDKEKEEIYKSMKYSLIGSDVPEIQECLGVERNSEFRGELNEFSTESLNETQNIFKVSKKLHSFTN